MDSGSLYNCSFKCHGITWCRNNICQYILSKTSMNLFKLYFLFLWTSSVCLICTIMYMASICRTKSPSIPEPKWMYNLILSTTEYPSYTRIMDGKMADLKLKWPKSEDKNLKPCQILQQNLQGKINITNTVTADDIRNVKVTSRLKYGGIYRPTDCKSNESTAVIIPFRDRKEHLETLVNLLHNMLQRQKLHYGIYVVEMALPVQFNRGLLANAGFLTARSIGNYSCYIIHDVDLLPVNDRNMYTCGKGPRHLVTNSTKYKHGLPYKGYVGGVLAMNEEQYLKVNGFSNVYFGWGGEDDDMFKRILSSNLSLERPEPDIGTYLALPHNGDISNPPNPHREMLISQATYRKDLDGLNSIKYQRQALEFHEIYTWILIRCVESEVLEHFPNLRAENDLLVKNKKIDHNEPLEVVSIGDKTKVQHKFVYQSKMIKKHINNKN